jgi:hypothetical protein
MVKRLLYESREEPRTHLAYFVAIDNLARRLNTLSCLTPYEYIAKIWTSEPTRFIVDAIPQMLGLNTYALAAASSCHLLQAFLVPVSIRPAMCSAATSCASIDANTPPEMVTAIAPDRSANSHPS